MPCPGVSIPNSFKTQPIASVSLRHGVRSLGTPQDSQHMAKAYDVANGYILAVSTGSSSQHLPQEFQE